MRSMLLRELTGSSRKGTFVRTNNSVSYIFQTIFLFLFLFIAANTADSQQVTWALRAGAVNVDGGTATHIDASGNVYMAGEFQDVVDLDPGAAAASFTSNGSSDGFVAKYSSSGQYLMGFSIGGSNIDKVYGVSTDAAGNIYITGFFRGHNVDFDPSPATAFLTSNGDAGSDPGYGGDIFVAKYSAAGQYQWAFNVGGTTLADAGIMLKVSAAGDVFVGGYFRESAVDFDPSAATNALNSANGVIFLARYNTNGQYQWAINFGQGNTDNSMFDLRIDAASNVYVTGYFQGTNIDFDPGPGTAPLNSNGSYEAFVAKYNAAGQYVFAFSIGGAGLDVGRGIVLDNTGNIYVVGDFSTTGIDFDPSPATALLSSNGLADVFIAKYTNAGQYVWAKNIGSTGGEFGWKIDTDNSGIFITGGFNAVADFDPSPATDNLTSNGGYDIFLAKYDLLGNYQCAFNVGSTLDDFGQDILVAGQNSFYLTGFFRGNVDFAPTQSVSVLNSAGSSDAFLVKYLWPPNEMPVGTLEGNSICTGQTGKLTFHATAGSEPFTLVYTDGANTFTQTNVMNGVPFNVQGSPSITTNYTLLSVYDGVRCSPINNAPNATATITLLQNCQTNCDGWLRLPSYQSHISVGDLDIPGNTITVEAKFTRTSPYPNGYNWAGDLVSKHNDPSNVNYLLRPNNAEITTSSGFFTTPPICEIELNKTYHVAMVYDGSTLKFYRNGFLMSSVPASGSLFQNNFQTRIGLYDALVNNTQFVGYIDEVRIWNVARTQSELQNFMNASLPNPTTQTGLLAYYTFEDLLNKQGNPTWNGILAGPAAVNQINHDCTFVADSCAIPSSECNSWMKLSDLGMQATVGDLDVTGNKITVEAMFNRINHPVLSVPNGGHIVSKHTHDFNVNYSLFSRGCEITTDVSGYKVIQVCDADFEKAYHVAMVYDGSMLKFYRDGYLMKQEPCTGNLVNNDLLTTLGQVAGGTNPQSNQVMGYLNEIRIWNVARTQAEIRTYMNAPLPNPTAQTGLLGYYVFNSLSNKAGNPAFDATLIGGATINQVNPQCTFVPDSCSMPDPCTDWLYTPTLGSKITVGDLDVTGNKITVEALVNRTTTPVNPISWGHVVSKHSGPGNVNYSLLPNGCDITTDVTGYKNITVCVTDMNKVYHIAMVYDGATFKFYRDGYLMGQTPCTGNLVNNDLLTTICQIADPSNPAISQFAGYVNEVRIWNIARTQNELRAYMNTSLPNPTTQTGLLGYYVFNDLTNKAGNPAYNGTLMGSASINQTNTSCTFQLDSCQQIVSQDEIINSYTPVTFLSTCNNKLIVENASDFNVGDTVLLIQMRGAIVDSTNTAAFGTITDYKNAGNYEFNYISTKIGNELGLLNTLQRTYDIANGKVQLIRVPHYQDLSTTGKLTCLPWDGSKGGVLVFNVQNSLQLNADIDVSGKGFKGGIDPVSNPSSLFCYEDQFFYPPNPDLASGKGEGIAVLSSQKSFGKGAPGNGGGGGNSHNSGGGGGSNGNAGGFGGYNFELTPCNTIVPFNNRGIGGYALTYNNAARKIFLGGGGGAGQSNNPDGFQGTGGNGGGIVIISANTINTNGYAINANGAAGTACTLNGTGCHEGMGGGGAGGTVLLNISNYADAAFCNVQGGNGGDMIVAANGRLGPGGGGGGGVTWLTAANVPPNLTLSIGGGANGVCTNYSNDPWGATPGQPGQTIFNLQLPVSNVPFKPNIDSVRFNSIQGGCKAFDFFGLAYVNTHAVASWQWNFGDGNTASVQNTNHTYNNAGTYTVKLVITDANGCKDSISRTLQAFDLTVDYSYDQDVCDPMTIHFTGLDPAASAHYWEFGDGVSISGPPAITHTYTAFGSYTVRYAISNGVCSDTITKTINVDVIRDNIILTQDTTICAGTTKLLRTVPSLDFCWTPVTYLDNPDLANPTTSAPQDITYHFTAKVTGNNLITNGNFSQGNTGFTSDYVFTTPNLFESQYHIGTNPSLWNGGMSPCGDHTTGTGNMMMVNGSPTVGAKVWKQTVTVTANTNYAFSTWIQAIFPDNPAQLQFSINGKVVGATITASLPTCTWTQFYTTWNSGNSTTADISIVNKNTIAQGNDFALDDISFAPVFIKRDSVKITVETPLVTTNRDTTICPGGSVQLNAAGAQTYSWTPSAGLTNPSIPNPVASPTDTTRYVVEGTTANGCLAKDTVYVNVFEKSAAVTASGDATICYNTSANLLATGGIVYLWSPAGTLSNPSAGNPVATPLSTTKYYVTITDVNTCSYLDSVEITVRPLPVFNASAPSMVCLNDSVRLNASGGDIYSWQPAAGLSDPSLANPMASPAATTDYSVTITETTCNRSQTISVRLPVMPLPNVKASRSTDIDCSTDRSQLSATGASKFLWSPVATLSNAGVVNPVARPTVTTKYYVQGTDGLGCSNYDSVVVKVDNSNKGGYLMPNAFTPNGDGLNDCYGIRYWGIIYEVEFSIFNRWGERIFYTKDPNQCWDGTYKGVQQDPNVFVYMIRAKTNCEPSVFRKGTFVLIR